MHLNVLTPFKRNVNTLELETANRISKIWYLRKHYLNMIRKYVFKIGIPDTLRTQFPFMLKDSVTAPTLSLEFTNNCNLKCPYCTSPKKLRDVGYMSDKTFNNLLKSLHECKVKLIGICGNGEPTIHPNFGNLITELKKVTPVLSLTSNGQFIKDNIIEYIINSKVDVINISVDSMFKENYEKMRPGGKFEKLIKNLKELKSMKEKCKSKLYINIRVMISPEDRSIENKIINFWKEYGDMVSKQYIAVINTLGVSNDFANRFSVDNKAGRYPRCTLPFKQLDVHWNGNVPLCTYSEMQTGKPGGYKIGNINEMSLMDIWSKTIIKEYRTAHRTRNEIKMPLCNGCIGT